MADQTDVLKSYLTFLCPGSCPHESGKLVVENNRFVKTRTGALEKGSKYYRAILSFHLAETRIQLKFLYSRPSLIIFKGE